MARYRKKPAVIDAAQWHGFEDGPHDLGVVMHPIGKSSDDKVLGWIETLEGGHIVTPGDWIITGIVGEKYPVKPDIFEKTYELVEEK